MKSVGLLRSVGTVSGFTGLSRLLGLVRDVLMASMFGTSLAMSAFVIAFRIPNLFRRLFGEGALSAGFVPLFVETREKEGDEAAWSLASHVFNLLFVFLSLVSLVVVLGLSFSLEMPWTPFAVTTLKLSRILFPYVIFICLVALCMGALNSFHHFLIPAATPCVLNICWIAALLFLAPLFGDCLDQQVEGVAWGIVLAGCIQLLVQWPVLRCFGYRHSWRGRRSNSKVGQVVRLAFPAALGASVTQFNVLIDTFLAAMIGDHAPAALFYSERLIYLPLGLFATAMGTVLLPAYSRQAALEELDELRDTVQFSMRNLLLVIVPASVGLFVLAPQIVALLFMRGAFDEQSAWYTMVALRCYAPGLLIFSLAKVFVPAFYGMKDTKTPVRYALITVGVNLALNVLFIVTFPVAYRHAGLALGTVLAEAVYVALLWRTLHRRVALHSMGRVVKSMGRFCFAALLMGLFCFFIAPWLQGSFLQWGVTMLFSRMLSLFLVIGFGVVVYVGSCALLRAPELSELKAAIAKAP